MTVTFTSLNYAGPVDEVGWAHAAAALGSTYGVAGAGDWLVSKDPTGTRQVKIAIGSGHGHGIFDTTDGEATLVLDTIATGTRWDLISAHRDWQSGAKVTTFDKTTGTAVAQIPSGRSSNPGVVDDQPLALVQLTAGQTVPTAVIDLRCWAANGGLVIKDVLALGYLTDAGTRVALGAFEYVRAQDVSGNPIWQRVNLQSVNLIGAGSSLDPSTVPPAIGALPFFMQAGSAVADTDASGYARITFPVAFPNGLLFAGVFDGDQAQARAIGETLSYGIAGSPWNNGRRTYLVYSIMRARTPGQNVPGFRHRANWIAIGW